MLVRLLVELPNFDLASSRSFEVRLRFLAPFRISHSQKHPAHVVFCEFSHSFEAKFTIHSGDDSSLVVKADSFRNCGGLKGELAVRETTEAYFDC